MIMIIFSIFILLVGLWVLYMVIEAAVKNGINKSVVGQFFEKKYGVQEKEESFLDQDLDNDRLI